MLDRQLRSKLDLLSERPQSTVEKIDETESKFKTGMQVMARSYQGRHKWTPGSIVKLQGRKAALVKASVGTWKRHFNQMRPSKTNQHTCSAETSEDALHPAWLFADNPTEPEELPRSTSINEQQIKSTMPSISDDDQIDPIDFEDALEEIETQSPERPAELRRSSRSTAEVPPKRFAPS